MKPLTGVLLVGGAVLLFILLKKGTTAANAPASSTNWNGTNTAPINTSGATTMPINSLGTASTQYIGSTPNDNFDSAGDPSSGDSTANASMFDAGVISDGSFA
jgi:hypothetical protein